MNVFRLAGDFSHLLAIIILLVKMWRTRSVAGISGKSQVLFALVFTTRYLDIFTNYVSPYNSIMKVVFLITAYGTLYLIFIKFKATYDSNHDTFRAELLVIPSAGLAVFINHYISVMEILWTFSIYLECVAIVPQLYMTSMTGEAETIISLYLFALGSYRGFYIINWSYRFYVGDYYDLIAIVAGCVQTALYYMFFISLCCFLRDTSDKHDEAEKNAAAAAVAVAGAGAAADGLENCTGAVRNTGDELISTEAALQNPHSKQEAEQNDLQSPSERIQG